MVLTAAKWCNLHEFEFTFQALKTLNFFGLRCLIINIHRRSNISMPHHVLDYLEVSFIFAEPCAESVAQYVGTELWQITRLSVFLLGFEVLFPVKCTRDVLYGIEHIRRSKNLTMTIDIEENKTGVFSNREGL